MNDTVAFLRAINVAGHAVVKMTDVRDVFVAAGCRRVRTYIQSGNVIFELPARKRAAVLKNVRVKLGRLIGGEPEITFRTVREIEALIKRAPFKRLESEPGIKLYVVFLSRKPPGAPRFPLISATEALEVIAVENREAYLVSRPKKNGFFGFPNNFIEKALGVPATSRNWTTVTKIVEFARKTTLVTS